MSLCHVLVSRRISNFFIICYGDLRSVIFDVIIVIVLRHHKPRPYKPMNLMDKCHVCSDCSTDQLFPSLTLSSGFSVPWDTTVLQLGQVITQKGPLSVQVRGRVHRCIKFHCYLVLRNCCSCPSLQQPLPWWSVNSHQHRGETLHQQKRCDLLKAQMMVNIFLAAKFFLNRKTMYFLRHNAIAHLIEYSIV